MKKLVFKKWVEVLLIGIFALGWFIVGAFEWPTFTPYIIGILMMLSAGMLEAMFGRGEE